MYNLDWLLTGILNRQMTDDKAILEDMIQAHKAQIPFIMEGQKYYECKNSILFKTLVEGTSDTDKKKNLEHKRLPFSWQKLLVDQKVSYIASERPVFSMIEDNDTNKKIIESIDTSLGNNFGKLFKNVAKESSNKGFSYLHPYIDEESRFRVAKIPSEQIIVIRDFEYDERIEQVIRYYEILYNNEPAIYAEWWNSTGVLKFLKVGGVWGEYEPASENSSAIPVQFGHFQIFNTADNSVKEASWERVPFIEFKNNEEMTSDLNQIKPLIDAFDEVLSNNCQDILDIQSIIFVLKNYGGTSLSDFMEDLKKYKAIKVEDEGGVETIKTDIPVEAIKEFISELKSLIIMMGQGLDPAPDKIGSGVSGVALEFLYSLLDMKCSNMENEFVPALRELLWFVDKYNSLTNGERFNPDEIQITLKRNKIRSDKEIVDIAKQSVGIISDKTILANHPWVKNPDDEIKAVEKQKKDDIAMYQDQFNNQNNNDNNGKGTKVGDGNAQ